MKRIVKMVWTLLIALVVSNVAIAAAPQSPEEAERQIKQLQSELKSLNQWLKETRSEKSTIESQLQDKEQAINGLLRQIEEIRQRLEQGASQIDSLQQQQQSLQLSIQKQNDQIAAQLRAVYRSGEQESLKLLLSGESGVDVNRLVYYNRYFSNARQSLINGYGAEVNELLLVEKSLRSRRAQQAREEERLVQERSALANEQKQRRLILAKLNNDLQIGDKKAAQLKQSQAKLQELLEKLKEALADIPLPQEAVAFSSLKGKLPAPLNRFSVQESDGQVNLGGITLSGREGDNVKAIYHGRVIFSDWLRGFGLLLILDHGDGYMSLYGYNQSLLKDVGEWVNANDQIATVGSSGGRVDSGLFFSIRHNGEPLNPVQWIRG